MDVVRRGIVILDLHRLSRHHTEHVRMILAATLIEHHGIFGNVEGPAAQTIFHIDENISQIAARHDDVLGFVRALAARILAHVDLRSLGSRAIKLYRAVNRRRSCRINRRGGLRWSRRLRGSIARLLRILFLVASRRQQQAAQGQRASGHHCPTCLLIHNVALSLNWRSLDS